MQPILYVALLGTLLVATVMAAGGSYGAGTYGAAGSYGNSFARTHTGPRGQFSQALPANPYAQAAPIAGGRRVEPNHFQLLTNTMNGKASQAAYSANAPFFYTDAAFQARKSLAPHDTVRTRMGTYETTHSVDSNSYAGQALGFQSGSQAFEWRNLRGVQGKGVNGLRGFASNPNSGPENPFDQSNVRDRTLFKTCSMHNGNQYRCEATTGCEYSDSFKCVPNTAASSPNAGHNVLYTVPDAPEFRIKIGIVAKGKANKVFTDIDTRTRLNQMQDLENKAVDYFQTYFGLDFKDYNTYGGAQMVPFKISDDILIQITDLVLPARFGDIPERNRVMIDGFMVKPMYGETVVLKGVYADLLGDTSVFMKEHETLIYYEYRIVDEFGHLFKKLRFLVPHPMQLNNKGITGWFACVDGGAKWGIGRDYGVSQIVNYADHEAFTFNNLIIFDKQYKFNHIWSKHLPHHGDSPKQDSDDSRWKGRRFGDRGDGNSGDGKNGDRSNSPSQNAPSRQFNKRG